MIEQAVRETVHKPEGALTQEDLALVTQIYIVRDEIYTTMDEFSRAAFAGQDTNDRGTITNISDLAYLPNLTRVCIALEHISDISALAELEQLQKIEFAFNDIEILEALAYKDLLQEVGLNGNPLTDISALGTCPAVISLDLRDTGGAYSGEALKTMNDFVYVDLCNDSDAWKYIAGKNIRKANVGRNQMNLDFIKEVYGLQELNISWTTITDISALEKREDIEILKMVGIPVDDISPLFTMPHLQSVTVSEPVKEKIEESGMDYIFEVLVQ